MPVSNKADGTCPIPSRRRLVAESGLQAEADFFPFVGLERRGMVERRRAMLLFSAPGGVASKIGHYPLFHVKHERLQRGSPPNKPRG